MERVLIQRLPNFWVPPIIPGTGKATDFKFRIQGTCIGSIGTKARENVGNSSQ